MNVRNGGCLGVNAVIKTFIVFRVVGGTLLLVVLFILLWLLYYYFYSPHDINRKHMTCSFMLKDFENVSFFVGRIQDELKVEWDIFLFAWMMTRHEMVR